MAGKRGCSRNEVTNGGSIGGGGGRKSLVKYKRRRRVSPESPDHVAVELPRSFDGNVTRTGTSPGEKTRNVCSRGSDELRDAEILSPVCTQPQRKSPRKHILAKTTDFGVVDDCSRVFPLPQLSTPCLGMAYSVPSKSLGNVVPKMGPRLRSVSEKVTGCRDVDRCLASVPQPQLFPPLGTLESLPLKSLGEVSCKGDCLGHEAGPVPLCLDKAVFKESVERSEIGVLRMPNCSDGEKMCGEIVNESRRQPPRVAKDTVQVAGGANESRSSVVLALAHSTPLKSLGSNSPELSNNPCTVSCKDDSRRSETAEPHKCSDKECSHESLNNHKQGDVLRRRSPRLAKLASSVAECYTVKTSHVNQLTRTLGVTNSKAKMRLKNLSVASEQGSSIPESMELLIHPNDLDSIASLGAPEAGNVVDEAKLMGSSNGVPPAHSMALVKDFHGSGCEPPGALAQPQLTASATKTKREQSSTRHPTGMRISAVKTDPHHCWQDIMRVNDQESLKFITSSRDRGLSEDQEAQGKEIVTRTKVRETLRLFQTIYRKLVQEEESKMKHRGRGESRVDLTTYMLLKEKGKCLGTSKYFGNTPGVEIGDEFHYKVELSIVGLHCNLMAGIDSFKYKGKGMAVSVVSSGGYNNIMDTSDVLVYSGSGGHQSFRGKNGKCPGDQQLKGGNLALKNSMDAQVPIRVIHGFKEQKTIEPQDKKTKPTYLKKQKTKPVVTYMYDGLYLVEKYWAEPGSEGFSTLRFQLRRMPGQPELPIKIVGKSRGSKVCRGHRVEDISQGKEKKSIAVVNDTDKELPMPFNYITRIIYPPWYNPTPPRGCDCIGRCSDSVKCACAVKNGGEIPFNRDGAIVEAKPLVYECGPSCKCPLSCHNRVSQHGIKFPLEIFKTKSMGWGVRSLTSIPSGSFICEYVGEMIEDTEADRRTNDDYLFDIGQNYNDKSLWEGLSTCIPDLLQGASGEGVEDAGFTVDAAKYGNVGRFINHSCTPNLYAQNLLYDHDDKSMPHVMLFAMENISPLEELTYHYNYTIDQVRDSHGNIKKKICYCGSIECTGRLY